MTKLKRMSGLGVIAALVLAGIPAVAQAAATTTPPTPTTQGIAPTNDQFVHAGANATRPFLTDRLLAGGGRETLLRFDLDSVPADTVITSATLDLYKLFGPGTVLVVSEIADSWTNSVSYATLPPVGAEVTRMSVGGVNSWYSFDVASAARAAADAGADLSLHITRSAAQNASEFASTRNAASDKQPRLTLTTLEDSGVVASDAAALDTVLLNPLYTDVSLPLSGAAGSSITWATSDSAVITTTGGVTRPTTAADITATLTATLTSGSSTLSKDLDVIVRGSYTVTPSHPQAYATDTQLPALHSKLASEGWASDSLANLKATIDPLVNRHQSDPEWILSRMGMYWKEGEHFTQVYIKAQNYERAEGNAPVPTVRYPAMRQWNDNKNAALEDRIPFSEDGSMMNQNGVIVPYAETGHMVRTNNEEILELGKEAAFLYWESGEEKYAEFASDIYQQWLIGVYYMNPALDPTSSLGGPGGTAPGGIGGYYDFEVIHDLMASHAGPLYDFLYDYLNNNVQQPILDTGKSMTDISSEVFKRFIDIGLVRGHADGNWNVNGWNCVLPAITALETNDFYADGKGREHYLEQYTSRSTVYHQALPDILGGYDERTGLWHESPSYAFGTVNQLLEFSVPVRNVGTDTIASNPILQKAALAILPWLDARGNLIVLGDGRGGAPSYSTFERLNSYYQSVGDATRAGQASRGLANAVEAGQYDRSKLGWLDILDAVPLITSDDSDAEMRTAYSAHHQHITMKNLNTPADGMMATLYGGVDGDHLNKQGLAAQIYAKGYAVGPNAKAYESYWTEDFQYTSGPAGANTIVPGYTHGPTTVNAMEPAPAADGFTNVSQISDAHQFSDVTAAEKRRQLAVVRTSPTTGFYVDVFRSDQADNDYLWHNLGDRVEILGPDGLPIDLEVATDLGTPSPQYSFFNNARSVAGDGDVQARWTVDSRGGEPALITDMWMLGQDRRTVYSVDAPPTTTLTTITPGGVNSTVDVTSSSTPTVIVRQSGINAATAPFASVFESYEEGEKSISSTHDFGSDGAFVGVEVASAGEGVLDGRTDYILSSSDDGEHVPAEGTAFRGRYGVASEDATGFVSLYLGSGTSLKHDGYGLAATGTAAVAAGIERVGDGLRYSADADVSLTVPYTATGADTAAVKLQYRTTEGWVDAPGGVSIDGQSVTGIVPEGSNAAIRTSDLGWEAPAGPATEHPGKGGLTDTSGHTNGLSDGNYTVTMNLWYGQNATTYELYENGNRIHSQQLTDETPVAQKSDVHITDRPNGTYAYTGKLINRFGSTDTPTRTVVVRDASPGTGVLSHNNWHNSGDFIVQFTLWWGTNGTNYRLFENDEVVEEKSLTATTPAAQSTSTAFGSKTPGTYVYRAELENAAGITTTQSITVTVD